MDMPVARQVALVREVRFAADAGLLALAPGPINNHAGSPALAWIAPHLTLRVLLLGAPDPDSGVLMNIVRVDELVRRHVVPAVTARLAEGRCTAEEAALVAARACRTILLDTGEPTSARLVAVRLSASPCLSAAVSVNQAPAPKNHSAPAKEPDMEPTVFLTQEFEFAASHRLHSPALSAADNLKIFGKCNNPAGHGHNYVLQVTLQGKPDSAGRVVNLLEFEAIVKARVLDLMDHRNLSAEVPPFSAGVNPTVEKIAEVCFAQLNGQFAPAALHRVRVWETEKTCAEVYASAPLPVDSLG